MSQKRILIVDDSAVYRRLLREAIEQHESLAVIGSVATGHSGLRMINATKPDAVISEILLPDITSDEFIKAASGAVPKIEVILFGHELPAATGSKLSSCFNGVRVFAPKPTVAAIDSIKCAIEQHVIPVLLSNTATLPKKAGSNDQEECPHFIRQDIDIVVIGASTGGPDALKVLIEKLPAQSPIPIVVAQHMPESFTDRLIDSLRNSTRIPVVRGEHGAGLEPGTITIAPGGYHLTITGSRRYPIANLEKAASDAIYRPSGNQLFKSAANLFGRGTLGIVLTGMGNDCQEGAKSIRESSGFIIAQDAASSTVWGMPGTVVEAGHAQLVLGIEDVKRVLHHSLSKAKEKSTLAKIRAGGVSE